MSIKEEEDLLVRAKETAKINECTKLNIYTEKQINKYFEESIAFLIILNRGKVKRLCGKTISMITSACFLYALYHLP